MTRTTKIPDRWLQGRTHMLVAEGHTHLEAIKIAIAQWLEQEAFAKEFGG